MSEYAARVAVIYYSASNTIHTLARHVVAGAEAAGAEVRVRRTFDIEPTRDALARAADPTLRLVDEAKDDDPRADYRQTSVAEPADVVWADAVIFGTPTRFGNVAASVKQFIDSLGGCWARGELANKLYSGFTSTSTPHGGQESTLLALYNSVYHFGGLIVPPGYTDPVKHRDGNPYGTGHVLGADDAPLHPDVEAAARFQGHRVATLAARFSESA